VQFVGRLWGGGGGGGGGGGEGWGGEGLKLLLVGGVNGEVQVC